MGRIRKRSLLIWAVAGKFSYFNYSHHVITGVVLLLIRHEYKSIHHYSDVLPWQCLIRYPESCQAGQVKFVDVDFPDLIERKKQTVLGTPELLGAFTGVQSDTAKGSPVVFDSDQYAQIGCDLRELDKLQAALTTAVGDVSDCEFIFVAEVSITYMETIGADNVIKWASSLGSCKMHLSLNYQLPTQQSAQLSAILRGTSR